MKIHRKQQCDGCDKRFRHPSQAVALGIGKHDDELVIQICPDCALRLGENDTDLSDRVDKTARERRNHHGRLKA